MQQLLDYAAILAFVVVYFISRDIFLATAVLMGGVTLQVVGYLLMKKPIGNELKVTFVASMLLGGMTLILRDETFIQWKPSIVNAILALTLVGGHLIGKTYFIKKMLGQVLHLPDSAWFTLTYGWALGFTLAGALNLWVAYNFDMDTWVTFRFAGLLMINITMLIATFTYLYAKGLLNEDNLPDPKAPENDDKPQSPQ